jgi:hypothetical protein
MHYAALKLWPVATGNRTYGKLGHQSTECCMQQQSKAAKQAPSHPPHCTNKQRASMSFHNTLSQAGTSFAEPNVATLRTLSTAQCDQLYIVFVAHMSLQISDLYKL